MRCITLKYPLVVVWMKALLDTARTSLLYGRQLCLSFMNIKALTINDKGLLVGKLGAPRPSGEHVDLGVT